MRPAAPGYSCTVFSMEAKSSLRPAMTAVRRARKPLSSRRSAKKRSKMIAAAATEHSTSAQITQSPPVSASARSMPTMRLPPELLQPQERRDQLRLDRRVGLVLQLDQQPAVKIVRVVGAGDFSQIVGGHRARQPIRVLVQPQQHLPAEDVAHAPEPGRRVDLHDE